MPSGLLPALRFARSWGFSRPPPSFKDVDVPVPGEAEPVRSTLLSPRTSPPHPGWVVLHGMTRSGRQHPVLLRFATGVAATGARVLVPDFSGWRDLRFDPERSQRILRAAVSWLHEDRETRPGGVVLAGFSFGAPQALYAAADPSVSASLRGVISWGGYADIGRVFRYSMTGEHEWEGAMYRVSPDPYGRWIMGANGLPLSAAFRGYTGVVAALRELAQRASDRRVPGSDPSLDAAKEEKRRDLSGEERRLFDLFVGPAGQGPDRERARSLADEVAVEARRAMPLLEPIPTIESIEVPVRLFHGRDDVLIPFTETLRLERSLQAGVSELETRVTGLFAHSAETATESWTERAREGLRFFEALRRVFEIG